MEAIPRCSYYQISTSDPISHSPTQRGKGLIPLTEKQGSLLPYFKGMFFYLDPRTGSKVGFPASNLAVSSIFPVED